MIQQGQTEKSFQSAFHASLFDVCHFLGTEFGGHSLEITRLQITGISGHYE